MFSGLLIKGYFGFVYVSTKQCLGFTFFVYKIINGCGIA